MRQPHALTAVKIGGGLIRLPGALERVCQEVGRAGRIHPLVVIPGGGPFADAVRMFDAQVGLSSDAAHWMAMLAMDQYAHVLAEHIGSAELVDEPGAVISAVEAGKVPVLAPYRWMRAADVLPHTWGVTSDSIAAFIAGALGAIRLVLVRVTSSDESTDPYFTATVPLGLPCMTLGWDAIEELKRCLSG
jgi:5-(aminomethyl)-3-furanmethanol phosphate kinase